MFGLQSGAALAIVVGVRLEVPVMLSVVRIVLRAQGWYDEHAHTVEQTRPKIDDRCR